MESRATQANTGGLTPSSVIAVLSDDTNTISLIKHILAMSKQIHFDLNVISSTFFNANQPYDADLVLLDRDFGQRPYNHTVNNLVQAQSDRPLPAIVVLLDEALLAEDLSLLASSVKTGVDDFILSSELSLKRILQIISAQPSAANAKPFVNTTATSAAPISTPLSTKLSATTTNTPAETINETTSTTHSTAPLESLQDESNQQQSQLVHLLSIDLESRRIHLSQNGHSILMDEADAILTIEEWLQLLDVEGAKKFNSLLQQASEFLAIPKSISCTIKSKS
ncbi:MAG: hypothetical protein P8J42_01285, partial [Pseudomonadales bacterium]|nr:hypothetical protein [Pseudomonadales bacterium]